MTDLTIIILYIVAVVNLILGLIIFSRGIRELINILFGFIALASALWDISIIGFYSPELRPLFPWLLGTHLSALLIASAFLYFSSLFPKRIVSRPVLAFFSVPFIASLSLLLLSDTVIGLPSEGAAYEINSGYPFYALSVLFYFFTGYFLLSRQYRAAASQEAKHQVEYVFLGSLISSSLAMVPNLILPFFGIFGYTWLGPIFTTIMVVFMFLAMLRYHLFNIKIILTEILAGSIVVTLLVEIFLTTSPPELAVKVGILTLVAVFSFLLIKGVYREVASREKIEKLAKDLQKANERLRELDQQKSEFVSIASHQLRAPLTAIKGYASMILEGSFGPLEPKAREAVERVYESTRHLAAVVEDLLNVTKIELGGMRFNFDKIDFGKLVREVAAELEPNVKKAGLSLEIADEGTGPYHVNADYEKLRQVVANLIDNAVKYTPKGGLFVRLAGKAGEGTVTLSVADTGLGIPKGLHDRLFEKFSRGDGISKVNTGGSGLGLYVAKEVVKAHGGRIWAESEGEGKGSTFLVELKRL